MSKTLCTCVAALALLAAPAAFAGVGKGDIEAGMNLSLSHSTTSVDEDTGFGTCTQDTTTDSGSFSATAGVFVTDMIEVKGALTALRSGTKLSGSCGSSTSVPDTTTGVFSPGADFVFLGKSGKVAPFVGAAYGLTFGDAPAGIDTDYYDVHAGAKFFIRERASIELKLTRFEPTDSKAGARTDLAVGLNVYF